MTDVFISYSRKDSDFMRRLHEALTKHQRDIWVDWEDIPLSADWWKEICAGKDPQPLDLHKQFIAISRRNVNTRQRTTVGALVFGLLIASVLAVFAFIQWQAAADNALRANNNAATAVAAVATLEGYIPKAVVEDGPLRLHEGPGQNYAIIGLLQEGATVSGLGRTGRQGTETEYTEWYLVEWEGGDQKIRGWIAAQFTNQNMTLTIEVPVIEPAPVTN